MLRKIVLTNAQKGCYHVTEQRRSCMSLTVCPADV